MNEEPMTSEDLEAQIAELEEKIEANKVELEEIVEKLGGPDVEEPAEDEEIDDETRALFARKAELEEEILNMSAKLMALKKQLNDSNSNAAMDKAYEEGE